MKFGALYLVFILLYSLTVFGQDFSRQAEEESQKPYTLELSQNAFALIGNSMLSKSIDEKNYVIDSGDIFLIKLDVTGPAVKVYQSTITPDGYLVLPDIKSISVRGLTLHHAKQKILNDISEEYKDTNIELFLFQVHPITVTVIGAVENEGQRNLTSNSRLFDAVSQQLMVESRDRREQRLLEEDLNSGERVNDAKKSESSKDSLRSLRNVKIIRDGKTYSYDLLKFKLLGDVTHNPYLMDQDVIHIPYQSGYYVKVEGAVKQPMEFEYRENDLLRTVLEFAGGLLKTADSSKIELYRFVENGKSNITKKLLDYKEDLDLPIKPDDRIYVRGKSQFHQKFEVEIRGEVKYPGFYPIEDGRTTLTDVINKSGGFTDQVNLAGAKIIRYKYLVEDRELNRLRRMTVEEMSDIEESYYRLRSRENLRLVSVDFESLFHQNNEQEDVVLRDQDVIIIPEKKKIVYVSGGVLFPGNITYYSDRDYRDYIESAGGFNKRARKGDIKIIKNKTGNWLDAEEDVLIEEGDIIFVPEKKERDWWEMFKEGLVVTSQIATIVFIISNAAR